MKFFKNINLQINLIMKTKKKNYIKNNNKQLLIINNKIKKKFISKN